MAETYKVLGQVLPANTSDNNLYTVPASTQVISSSISICNITAGAAKFRVRVRINGAAATNAQYIYFDVNVPVNDTYIAVIGMTLNAGDLVDVRTDTSSALAFNLFGVEVTP